MKSILVIGAGFLQAFVIKKAKALGYYVLAIDKNPKSIGFAYADKSEAVDIIDIEACYKFAQKHCIDGVLTAATDYGVLSAAYIAHMLGLPGLDYDVAKIVKNKFLVRDLLAKLSPEMNSQYYEIDSIEKLGHIAASIKYPVMVKPCDGSGSKGVRKADDINQLQEAVIEAQGLSLSKKVLIEEFFEGKEFGVEAFVDNYHVHVLGVMGKHMTSPPDYAELGHFIPSQSINESRIKDVARKAIQTIGINFGAVNMDVLVSNRGEVRVVDLGARMGGNLIGSHIIPIGTGVDYMGNLIKSAVGDPIDLTPKTNGLNIATRLLALRPGKIVGLPNISEIKAKHNVEIFHHLQLGDIIREYHNNLDGCGYVIASGDDLQQADILVSNVKSIIDESIIRA